MFSPFSEANSRVQPGRRSLSSQDVGWRSLLVEQWSQPGVVQPFETIASPDQTVVLTTAGVYDIEVLSGGHWRRARYQPGDGGATAPLNTNQIRWSSAVSSVVETLHIYVPPDYFREAAEEYRRAGRPANTAPLDALSLSDPLLFSLARSLVAGIVYQAPDLYADAAARMLATHILLRSGNLPEHALDRNLGSDLTDRRIARVLDFMHNHFAAELTLDQLAREAGISRFHFVRLFHRRLRITPHQYLVRLRLDHAKRLLETTDLAIGAVASACGYTHAGRFAAAFHAAFAVRPSRFRRAGP